MLNSTGYVQSRRGEYTKVAALKVGLLRLNVLAGTRYKVQGTRYKVPGTRYQVQGTRYKVHEISSDMKSRRTWNLKWHQISTPPHIYLNFFGILSFVTQVNSLPRTSSKPNKSEWVYPLLCQMSWTVDVHEMSNVECWMWNVHCSQLCTTVHNCS